MKRCSVRNIALILFVMLQIILYAAFLSLDIKGSSLLYSRNIKYSIIILCFCYALIFGKSADKGIIFCVKAGLFFTVLSDLFLLMLDYYICGVLTFIIVQQLYGFHIILADLKRQRDQIDSAEECTSKNLFLHKVIFRIGMELALSLIACFILWVFGVSMELLLPVSIFYFTCIVTNVITSIMLVYHNPANKENVLFAVGMSLFLLCDINVGLFNMSGFISMPNNIYQTLYTISSVMMWAFYAPSQVLIALSASASE